MGQNCVLATLLTWAPRRWLVALGVGTASFLALGLPTAVIANPVFGRSIPPTPWAMGVLLATSVLAGLLAATYVRNDGPAILRSSASQVPGDPAAARRGTVGGLLALLAIGCPVCNKVVLLTLGATGAVRIFAPVQPYLAAAGIVALAWALLVRLRGERACPVATRPAEEGRTTEPAGSGPR